MAQRLSYNYDYGFQREKVSKINEIESYVSVLIENNKNYADQLNILRRENTDLRGELELMMGEMLRLKEHYEGALADTRSKYSQEIGKLIEELKDILHKKEQMEGSYKSLLQELSYQCELDKKNRTAHIQELQRNYENKFKIQNDRIQEQNRQLQSNYYLNSDSKLKLVKEIDALKYELGQLRKQNLDLGQAQAFHEAEIGRLSTTLKAASKEREDLSVTMLKVEQEKNQAIIDLRQLTTQLRQQLNDQIDNVKKMEVALIAKERQLQNTLERLENQRKDKNQYQDCYHRVSAALSDKEKENSGLRTQLNKLTDFSNREIKRLGDLVRMFQNDNSKLTKDLQQCESRRYQKEQQAYVLLQRVKCLQQSLEATNSSLLKLEEDNIAQMRNNEEMREEVQILLLENKKAGEKCQLQANHIDTLQKLIEKEKRKVYNMETAAVTMNRQSSESEARQYQLQLQDVLKRTEQDQSELAARFQLQKEKIIRMYQKALRQKQMLFKQKIHFLQSEILQLSK